MEEVELTIIQAPVKVKFDCPFCECEIEIDYEEFCDDMMNDYPGDWEMETIKCTNCHKEVVIGNIEWD